MGPHRHSRGHHHRRLYLQQAAAQLHEDSVTTGPRADLDVEESEPEALSAVPANDAFDALRWLIWPTERLEGALEVGAFRILSMDSKVAADSVDGGTVTWMVTVKLTDVDELRRLAAKAHPDESALISDSLAVAWQRAADPFAPLRSIPGIAWQPGESPSSTCGRGRQEPLTSWSGRHIAAESGRGPGATADWTPHAPV